MKTLQLFALACIALPALAQTSPDLTFLLDQSTLTYHMSHPIHEVDGVSHAAKGKGVCHESVCDFLLAAPVKSFDSGDTNRDLHMLQVARGADFPLVTVRFRIPEADVNAPTFDCDLEVSFAGNTDHYYHVPFQQEIHGETHHITGTIPTTLSGFKIPPPSFLGVAIKNEIPVRVDTTWRQQ
jgi:hypothetical protein